MRPNRLAPHQDASCPPERQPAGGREFPALFALALGALLTAFATATLAQETSTSRSFFLPANPVAAAYVLGRLSNAELIAAPRSEFVYEALVERKGVGGKYHLEGLEGLSKLHHSSIAAELIRVLGLLDKKGDSAADTMRELCPILLKASPAELGAERSSLMQLAKESGLAVTRQVAYAACVAADGSPDPMWDSTKSEPAGLVDLVAAIPLLPAPALRSAFYSKVEPLVQSADSAELRRAAVAAVVAIPGHEAAVFSLLAGLVEAGTEREAAVEGLLKLAPASWVKERAAPLSSKLLDYLRSAPPEERTSAGFASALQLAGELATLLPEPAGNALTRELRGLGPTVVVLHAIYEQMRFDKQLIAVQAGKPISITLQNDDAMPHNLAILRPGSLEEIGKASEKMPAEPDAQGRMYVPASPNLLFATKLIPPGEKGSLSFDAPLETGEYAFVCTFPGHWLRMSGVLAVVSDVEDYLAKHATSMQPKITEWKLADLAPELVNARPGVNPGNGKELFSKLACVQCHRLGQQGYSFGPDLTQVFSRYKNDRVSVLQQILEPSKIVESRYRNVNFELKDGEPVLGVVLKEDAGTVTVQTGPADSLIQTIKKSDITQRQPRDSSPMPVGLLNALSKDQIFDLLGYLESGGEPEHHVHR